MLPLPPPSCRFRLRHALVVAASLGLAACGTLAPQRPYWIKSDSPAPASSVDAMIAYHAFAAGLGAADWARESARLRTTAREADETQCVRQAMLAAAPAAPAAERAQAGAAYEQCERELRKRESSLVGLVVLLRVELAERIRSEERQREAQRRADEQTQKLDELKAIERNLLERSTAPKPKKP